MDGAENVDAEMDAIFNGTDGQPSGQEAPAARPQTGETANPSEAAVLEAGGRKWKSPSDLAKAYSSLQQEYSRKSNGYKEAEPWLNFSRYLAQHPELRKELDGRIKEYNERRQAGQSQATAKSNAGIPDEIAEKLERLEAAHATYEVKDEMNQLRGRYKVDEATMKEVLRLAMSYEKRGQSLSLEDAYKLHSYGKQREAGADEARANLQKKKEGHVQSSSVPHIQPKSDGMPWKNDGDWGKSLSQTLDKYGIQ